MQLPAPHLTYTERLPQPHRTRLHLPVALQRTLPYGPANTLAIPGSRTYLPTHRLIADDIRYGCNTLPHGVDVNAPIAGCMACQLANSPVPPPTGHTILYMVRCGWLRRSDA